MIALLLLMFTIGHYELPHGTTVITLFTQEGIVMASDGLQITEISTGDPAKPFRERRDEAEPKVAVCNKYFLCGMSGINPISLPPPIKVEYHFHKWLPDLSAKTDLSVEYYAKTVQRKARITFKNMDVVMKQDNFWKSEISKSETFLQIAVAGYDKQVPRYCVIRIKIDREKRQLIYFPKLDCATPEPHSATSILTLVLSGHDQLIARSRTQGTADYDRFRHFVWDAKPKTGTLFPGSPPSVDDAVAWAAATVAMQKDADPQTIGGTTRIGVLVKGKLPTVGKPLTLDFGK